MKKINIVLISFLFCLNISAQGLEDIIVETYYVTDSADALYKGSAALPVNSVTYRIFVDMKPGYRLQSVYGSPGHEMILSTSTFFFNHPVFGHYIPNLIMDRQLGITTLMLDSWISMGAGSQQKYALPKQDDDTTGTIANGYEPPILQSENAVAGIPIKFRDGLVKKQKPPLVTQLGLDSLLEDLNKISTRGEGFVFSTINGGWACVGGAEGCDAEMNRVLIGQFTTNGKFDFEFNIQLGKPGGGVEQYVAKNPTENEILFPKLKISPPLYNSQKQH